MRNSILLFALLAGCAKGSDDTGVDSDTGPCTDADSDGSCAESGDCDDTNALVHAGTDDIPYNGRDEDCDGKDLDDFDGDGFAGGAEGPDCNDSNPTVNPGAQEICYDVSHLDENCDGLEPGEDCDQDGFVRSDDCDDHDPLRNPGVTETWYDGIDSDCSYSSDWDKDGDGDEIDSREGGGDCDDEDPARFSDATEVWDGFDSNCDGLERLGNADAWRAWDGALDDLAWTASLALLNDIDGDGFRDVFAGDPIGGPVKYGGQAYVMSIGAEDGRTDAVSYTKFIGITEQELFGWSADNAGDIDGDGLDDMLVGAPGFDRGSDAGLVGAAMLFLGTDLAAGGTVNSNEATAVIYGGQNAGLMVAGLGDVDGDGVDELAAGTDNEQVLSLYFFSGALVQTGGTFTPDQAIAYVDDTTALGGALVGKNDLDGDGQIDVLFARTTPDYLCGGACGGVARVYVATPEDIARGGQIDLTPLTSFKQADDSAGGLGATLGVIHDVDQDGYDEVVAADPLAVAADGSAYGGSIYVINGDNLVDNELAPDLAMFEVDAPAGNTFLRVGRRSGDHDADGLPDLMIGGPGNIDAYSVFTGAFTTSGDGYVFAFSGETVAAGGTVTTDDAVWSFTSELTKSTFGMALDVRDIDEDGYADLAVGGPLYGYGKLFVFSPEF